MPLSTHSDSCGKCLPQPPDRSLVVAPPLDGVEIGDVECLKRVNGKEPARDIDRIAARRQRRLDRPVAIALAHLRTHHRAIFEIEDRNDLHGAIALPESANWLV